MSSNLFSNLMSSIFSCNICIVHTLTAQINLGTPVHLLIRATNQSASYVRVKHQNGDKCDLVSNPLSKLSNFGEL